MLIKQTHCHYYSNLRVIYQVIFKSFLSAYCYSAAPWDYGRKCRTSLGRAENNLGDATKTCAQP